MLAVEVKETASRVDGHWMPFQLVLLNGTAAAIAAAAATATEEAAGAGTSLSCFGANAGYC